MRSLLSLLLLAAASAAAPEPPSIELVLAFNPSNDLGYGVADTMSIAFDKPTDKAGGHRYHTKAQVDALVRASQSLGLDYSAKWADAQSLVISVVNPAGAVPPPRTGELTFTVVGELRTLDGLSEPSRSTSPPILGSFAVAPLVTSATAGNPPQDFGYGAGDTLTFVFDMPTNMGGGPAELPDKAAVDALLWSSTSLGAAYSGAWLNASALQIEVLDAAGADPDAAILAAEFEVLVKNADETSETTTEPTPPLQGSFWLDPATVITSLQPASVVVDSTITFRLGTIKQGDVLDEERLQVSFATPGNCASREDAKGHLFPTPIEAGQRVTRPTLVHTVGHFAVCFSSDFGRAGSWVEQTTPGLRLAVMSTAPQFVSAVASNPSGDSRYGAGDTIALAFDQPTDQQGLLLSRAAVDALVRPSQALGDGYSAEWVDPSNLLITITDPANAAPPKVGELTFTVMGGLLNQDQSSSPSSATSPPVEGSFSEPPRILSAEASNPPGDHHYGAGDTITLVFDSPTNRAHASQLASRAEVDAVVRPSQDLGADYSAAWVDDATLVVAIQNARGAHPPQVGVCTFTVVGDVRTYDGTSRPSDSQSPPLVGAFSEAPAFVSVVAGNPTGRAEYGEGNTITLKFNAATDQGSTDFLPSQALGKGYTTEWRDASTVVITITDAAGAAPPQIGVLTFKVVGDLQNEDRTCRSTALSPPVTGSFARPPAIVAAQAANPPLDYRYGEGDVITLSFDRPTDAGATGARELPTREDVDAVVLASERLGADYSGEWLSATMLEISVLSAVGAAPPRIGSLTFAVVGDVQNLARTSGPSRSTSPPVEGVFAQPPGILSVVADNPSGDFQYGAGDTVTLTFSTPTNQLESAHLRSRAAVDALVQPSQPLGRDYTAAWRDASTLVIRVTDATGIAEPPQIGQLTFSVVGDDVRTQDRTSAPSAAVSPPATGVFARAPGFVSVTAGNPIDDAGYGAGDTIVVEFNTDTDRAGELHSRAAVDALLEPSQSLGKDYSAVWRTPSTLAITIVDARGALPPQVGRLTFAPRAPIRNAQRSSGPCTETSPPLSGAFSRAVRFKSVTAGNPPADGSFGIGDTITVVFDAPTDRAGAARQTLPSRGAVDALLEPSQPLGTAYSAAWADDDATLVIEILDPSRAGPPQIDHFTFSVVGPLRRADLTSAVSRDKSPPLRGSFASPPRIVAATAGNPPQDFQYGAGDTVTLTFDVPTNHREDLPNKAAVDALVRCTHRLGAAYSGSWHSASSLEIRILEPVVPAADGPRIGNTTCAVVGALRKEDLTSGLSKGASPPLDGVFAEPPAIAALEAGNPLLTDEYDDGDTLTVAFGCPTDLGAAGLRSLPMRADVDALLDFSMRLGADYSALWVDAATLVVTVLDARTAEPPRIGELTLAVRPEAGLRTADGASEPSAARSAACGGSFAKEPEVVSLVARNPSRDTAYGLGDTLTVTFDRPTNMGDLPAQLLNRAAVHDLATPSQRLGTAYSAAWKDAATLVVTVQDPRNAAPPAIGELTLALHNIRNAAGTSASVTVDSPPVVGAFVRAPEFLSVTARMARSAGDDEYGAGDTITLVFDADTNQAPAPTLRDKSAVDALVQASMDLGAAYSAAWLNRRTLEIEILDATGAEPPQVGVLRFTVLAGAGLRTAALTSFPSRDTSPLCAGKFGAADRPPPRARLDEPECPPPPPCDDVCADAVAAAEQPWSLLGLVAAMAALVPGLMLVQYLQWRLHAQLRLPARTFFQLLWPALVVELVLWKVYCDHFELPLATHAPHLYALFLTSAVLVLALLGFLARLRDDGLFHASSQHPRWEYVGAIVCGVGAVSWQFGLHWGWTLAAVVLYVNMDFVQEQTLQALRTFYDNGELEQLVEGGVPLREVREVVSCGVKPTVGALLDLHDEGEADAVLRRVRGTFERLTHEDHRVAREFRDLMDRCVAHCFNTRVNSIPGLEFKTLCGQADSSLSGEEFSRVLQMCTGQEGDADLEAAVAEWWHGPGADANAFGGQLSMTRNGRDVPDERHAPWPVAVLTVEQVSALHRMRATRRESLFVALFAELRETVCLGEPEPRWCDVGAPGGAAAAATAAAAAAANANAANAAPESPFRRMRTPRGARVDAPVPRAVGVGGVGMPGMRRRGAHFTG